MVMETEETPAQGAEVAAEVATDPDPPAAANGVAEEPVLTVAVANGNGAVEANGASGQKRPREEYPDTYPFDVGPRKFKSGTEVVGYLNGVCKDYNNGQELPEVRSAVRKQGGLGRSRIALTQTSSFSCLRLFYPFRSTTLRS